MIKNRVFMSVCVCVWGGGGEGGEGSETQDLTV